MESGKSSGLTEIRLPKIKVVEKGKAEIPAKKKESLEEIVRALEAHMKKTEEQRKTILARKPASFTPKENVKFLEEIVIPPLKMLKEESPKKS